MKLKAHEILISWGDLLIYSTLRCLRLYLAANYCNLMQAYNLIILSPKDLMLLILFIKKLKTPT
jgi:hypothetical protein